MRVISKLMNLFAEIHETFHNFTNSHGKQFTGLFLISTFVFCLVLQQQPWNYLFLAISVILACYLVTTYRYERQIRELEHFGERIQEMIKSTALAEYRQVEALIALNKIIDFQMPAPNFRGWPISPDFAMLIVSNILQLKSDYPVLIECGSGSSTIVTGLALRKRGGGKLISLEHDHAWFLDTKKQIQIHQLSNIVELIYAPLVKQPGVEPTCYWYDIKELNCVNFVDLLVVDGPPGDTCLLARYPALPILYPLLKSDAIILLDDAARSEEKEIVCRWISIGIVKLLHELPTETGAVILQACKPPSDHNYEKPSFQAEKGILM